MTVFAPETREILAAARACVLHEHRNALSGHDLLRACAGSDAGAGALYQSGCDEHALLAELDPAVPAQFEQGSGPGPLYTEDARLILERARDLAHREQRAHVDAAALVAALCSVPGPAADVLVRCGVAAARASRRSARGPEWLTLREGSELQTQLVAAVEEAVATGRLAEGERLPAVRALSEQLGVAPGTVAAAYRELGRRGVVESQGVKGTLVARTRQRSPEALEELERALRAAVLVAYRAGASADEVRAALERALLGVDLG